MGHSLTLVVCSTRTPELSKLKERTAPLLKPQKKFGIVGWKATAQGVSSEDEKSYSCCRVARSQIRTVWSRDTVAICPRFGSVESANTGAMWERANTVYSREGTSRKPRWPEVVVDSTRRPSGLKETELTGPSCSVGRVGRQPLGLQESSHHTMWVLKYPRHRPLAPLLPRSPKL